MSTDPPRTTDFGFQEVPWSDKARRVRGVFDSVADRYDLMNDLMSGGAHRLWKRFALELTGIRPGGCALDVAGGTGDLPRAWRVRSARRAAWSLWISMHACCSADATA